MATVRWEGATRIYAGTTVPALDAFDLAIDDGEFMVLVGPSGSGKSTALRMLAGLEGVDEGAVFIGERDVTKLPPKSRDIAMVFQDYALYPHMTVAENIGFHLRIAKRPKEEIKRRVMAAAQLLDLEPFLDRKPAKLSGGQRQRVAMGRAIIREPQVFLMDEPLSNLDAKLRVQTRAQIASLQRRLGITTIYVTHDQVEAMTLGDRVAVLHEGVLQQCDKPPVLFDRPANAFVAGFIGSPAMNLMSAAVGDGSAHLGAISVPLTPAQQAVLRGGDVIVGIRPEGFALGPPDQGGLPGLVVLVEELGADAFVYVNVDLPGGPALLTVRTVGRAARAPDSRVSLVPSEGAIIHLFSAATGERLLD